jgi:hypothetical protein
VGRTPEGRTRASRGGLRCLTMVALFEAPHRRGRASRASSGCRSATVAALVALFRTDRSRIRWRRSGGCRLSLVVKNSLSQLESRALEQAAGRLRRPMARQTSLERVFALNLIATGWLPHQHLLAVLPRSGVGYHAGLQRGRTVRRGPACFQGDGALRSCLSRCEPPHMESFGSRRGLTPARARADRYRLRQLAENSKGLITVPE